MFRKVFPFALTAVLVASAACGGDDDDDDGGTGPTGDQLSTVEFESMVEAFSAINSIGLGGIVGFSNASSPAIALQSGSQTYSATEQCPNGGSTTVSGTYTVTVSGTNYVGNYTITQSYNDCRAQSSNGTTWTFNGNPNIAFSMNYSYNQSGSWEMDGSQTGGLSWAGGGKSGSCSINTNLDYTGTVSGQSYTYTYSYTGTVCGQTVNETWTYGV